MGRDDNPRASGPTAKRCAVVFLSALLVGELIPGATAGLGAAPAPASSVAWGGRGFSNPTELARWLRARGLSYATWARNHPRAAARLEGRELPTATTESATPDLGAIESVRSGLFVEPDEPIVTLPSPTPGSYVALLTNAFVALGLALIGLAAVPVALLQRANAPAVLNRHRPEFAGAGIAIGLAVGAAQLF